MNERIKIVVNYIIELLLGIPEYKKFIHYGSLDSSSNDSKIVIIPSGFFDNSILYTKESLPKLPLSCIEDTDIPFLFGKKDIVYKNEKVVIYADIIASAFYMLSRYEEVVKNRCRDNKGRFLGKDSIVFSQGLSSRPLVDEWGSYLRNICRNAKIKIDEEQPGFSKLYLTHDIDIPFKIYNLYSLFTQYIKNAINHGIKINNPLKLFLGDGTDDPYYTFDNIINIDKDFNANNSQCEIVYFIISRGNKFSFKYCNIHSRKYLNLIKKLNNYDVKFGVHLSCESGKDSVKIRSEIVRLKELLNNIGYINKSEQIFSRHHCLMWNDPKSVDDMEKFGITDDFTLGYADNIGFRCGTSKPYRFIDPYNMRISNVLIHPLLIMDCTLDRSEYMNLSFEEAFIKCCKIIDEVYKYNGEVNILWHNSSFVESEYQEKLYIKLLKYIEKINLGE